MSTFRVINDHAIDGLQALPDQSVQCCVTSPPYYGLRDYGVEGQIGLEPTPDDYVARLVAVFREIRRVLKDDGTVWLNLGDSYVASPRGNKPGDYSTSSLTNPHRQDEIQRGSYEVAGSSDGAVGRAARADRRNRYRDIGKPKDLIGIPWMVAFALRSDGWYLRSDIIWSKPNPMPESVTDRPTRAHEYLFLLTKKPKYYYDADAIAEPVSGAMLKEVADGYDGAATKDYSAAGVQDPSSVKARIIANARRKNEQSGDPRKVGFNDRWDAKNGTHSLTRNKRTVWTITPQPFKGAHFATFPEKLVEPCILAGSKPGDLILDPFNGSGRAGIVAIKHQRNYVGVDLNADYCAMAIEAIAAVGGVYTEELCQV